MTTKHAEDLIGQIQSIQAQCSDRDSDELTIYWALVGVESIISIFKQTQGQRGN